MKHSCSVNTAIKKGLRIHIVGASPRTGTTLMTELMVNCFDIDKYEGHEISIFKKQKKDYDIYCTKNPRDILVASPLLSIDSKLWMIHMERDPRDVIVSRHKNKPAVYWTNLRLWKMRRKAIQKASKHQRFIVVRYEDLVKEPDGVQQELINKMPFLVKKSKFSDFYKMASPSDMSINALQGLRPVNTKSIGKWRDNKPRVAAQLRIHGDISRDLIELGYEKDNSWIDELKDVEPDNNESYWPEKNSLLRTIRKKAGRKIKVFFYALKVFIKVDF